MTKDQFLAITECISAFGDIVKAHGEMGCPAGPMYVRVQAAAPNITLDMFQGMMNVLVKAGKVRYSNHCYYHQAKEDEANATA